MAANHGTNGVIKVGSATVAIVKNWTYEESVENPESHGMGAVAKTRLTGGPKDYAGTITCLYDKTDSNGQMALVADAEITLHLHQDGDASGDEDRSGPAIIQKMGMSVDMNDAVEVTFDWIGNGVWTAGSVA